ncbi:hypothetical protein BH09ACT3_BH09ACT3_10560 [soil metagenome]
MTDQLEELDQAIALLADLARLQFAAADDETACALSGRIEQAGRLIDGLRALSAADLDRRSAFELGSEGLGYRLGHRRGVHLVEYLSRTSQGDAARRIRLGRAISPRSTLDGRPLPAEHPHVAAAVMAGTMGVDAAANVIRCLDQAARTAPQEHLDAAELALVEASTRECADLVAAEARLWREALDPDGAALREGELRQQRRFSLGRESHGLTAFSGACDPVSAALLRAAFAESTAPDARPRFLDAGDFLDADVATVRDPRTREQRQFDVLIGLITAGLRSTGSEPGGMRSTATVMAVVKLSDLDSGRGVGWLDDVAEPISVATVRELACGDGYRTLVTDDFGEPLYEGRRSRYFTPAQRRALAVRDGGCVWPQCTAPPTWCHAHHVEGWKEHGHHGATDLDNGVLLCPAHHHMLHNSAFTMKMIDGRPRLLAPPWIDRDQAWRPVGRGRVSKVPELVGRRW